MSALVVGSATVPRVNLLPPEIAQRRRLRRIQAGLGATVAASAATVGLLYLHASGTVTDAQASLDEAQATNRSLQREAAEYAHVPVVYAQVDAAEAQLGTAMGQEVRWSSYLNDLSRTMPPSVWLTQMTVTQNVDGAAAPAPTAGPTSALPATPGIGQVQFTGKGLSHDDVATWLETLSTQKGYADPYFTNAAKEDVGGREVVGMTSQVTVTAEALSQRYTGRGQ